MSDHDILMWSCKGEFPVHVKITFIDLICDEAFNRLLVI